MIFYNGRIFSLMFDFFSAQSLFNMKNTSFLLFITLLTYLSCDSDKSSPYDLVLENGDYITKPDSNGITTYYVADTLFTGSFRTVLNDTTIEDMKIYKGYLRHRHATYEDGKIQYERRYVNDMPSGKHVFYFRNGSRKSFEYFRKGKKHGDQYYWDYHGKLLKEENYTNGKLNENE